MNPFKLLNLALAFTLELCALMGLGAWGFAAGGPGLFRYVLGLGTPALVMAFWALYMAPKSSQRLPRPRRLPIQLLIFESAALGLASSGRLGLGEAMGIASLLCTALMWIWKQ